MCAYNAVSPNNDIILCGDYHAAVAQPAILFNDDPPHGTKSLLYDRLIHIRIFMIVVSNEYPGSRQYILSNANLVHRGYHRPTPYAAPATNHDSRFRTLWNDGDVQPHVAM